jgi:hypothetical protein
MTVIALPLGFILVFTHRSTKPKGLVAKIGVGLLAGFGICILLNAIIEVLDYGGVF